MRVPLGNHSPSCHLEKWLLFGVAEPKAGRRVGYEALHGVSGAVAHCVD